MVRIRSKVGKCFRMSKALHRRGVAQPGSAPALGAGGPEFKSRRPDQNISRVFFGLLKAPFTLNLICEILAGRRPQSATRLMAKSSPRDKFSKNTPRRECHSEIIELTQHKKISWGG